MKEISAFITTLPAHVRADFQVPEMTMDTQPSRAGAGRPVPAQAKQPLVEKGHRLLVWLIVTVVQTLGYNLKPL